MSNFEYFCPNEGRQERTFTGVLYSNVSSLGDYCTRGEVIQMIYPDAAGDPGLIGRCYWKNSVQNGWTVKNGATKNARPSPGIS